MNSADVLKKYFDYDSFRPGQEEIINLILDKKNVLAILATGAGKSICYQIPAIMGNTFSIVISPLISLMQDQVDSINKITPVAQFINSTLNYRETEQVLNLLTAGKLKLLYLAPEKLENAEFAERIKNLKPEFIFVDEAHCISEWGHNFRPSYRKIREFCDYIGCENISAFTATATPEVRNDIVEQLRLENPNIVVRGFERKNLELNVIRSANKKETVFDLLSNSKVPAIIYTPTRKQAEEVSNFLNLKGIKSEFYHAGLSSELRHLIQDNFSSGNTDVITATNAFGMGIDKSNIRTIVHTAIPSSIENYYQEIGRAGRDKLESKIFLLEGSRDAELQEYFISSGNPKVDEIKLVYDRICDSKKIALGSFSEKPIAVNKSLQTFFTLNGINQNKLNSSIKMLEDAGYLHIGSELNKKHHVKFLLRKEKLKNYVADVQNNSLRNLIIAVLRIYGTKILEQPTAVVPLKIKEQSGIDEKKLIENLEILAGAGIVDYQPPSKYKEVTLTAGRVKAENLQIDGKRIAQIEQGARERVEAMLSYCSTTKCRSAFILNYFGENRANYKCGICDNCTGRDFADETGLDYLGEIIVTTVHEGKGALKVNELVKILQGKSTKYFAREYSSFGYCEFYNDSEIQMAIDDLVSKNILKLYSGKIYLNEPGKEIVASPAGSSLTNTDYEYTLSLFDILREARKAASKKFSQSSQIVCTDKVLREIAERAPKSASELLSVAGFSQKMFNKVGEDFLFVIGEHVKSNAAAKKKNLKGIPKNISSTLSLVEKGYSLKSISSFLKTPESIVSLQIESILDYMPELKIDALLDKKEIAMIKAEIDGGIRDLKTLKQKLPPQISYAMIRIVVSKYRAR